MALTDVHPIPEENVPRAHISSSQIEEWRQVAHDEVLRAVKNEHSWYFDLDSKIRDGYDMIADKHQLRAYVRDVPNATLKNVLIRARLDTNLDNLAYALHCDNTLDQRRVYAHLYQDHFLDGGIVHVSESKTEEDPFHFVGMKWSAFRSPVPSLLDSRDYIYFAYYGTVVDAQGRKVLFRFMRSMPMDGVEIEERVLPNMVRGRMSHVHLYRQDGDRVQLSVQAMHSTEGSLPGWAVTKTLSMLWPGIVNLATLTDAKTLTSLGMTKLRDRQSSSWAPFGDAAHTARLSAGADKDRGSCRVCLRRFRMTRPKRLCSGCGCQTCKSCTVRMCFFDEQKMKSATAVAALRFCIKCIEDVRHHRGEELKMTPDALYASFRQASSREANSDVNDDDLDLDDFDHDIVSPHMDTSDLDDYNVDHSSSSSTSSSTSSGRYSPPESSGFSLSEATRPTPPPLPLAPGRSRRSLSSTPDRTPPFRVHSAPNVLGGIHETPEHVVKPLTAASLRRLNSLSAQEAKDLEATFRERVKQYTGGDNQLRSPLPLHR